VLQKIEDSGLDERIDFTLVFGEIVNAMIMDKVALPLVALVRRQGHIGQLLAFAAYQN